MRFLFTIVAIALCLLGLTNCTMAPDKPLYEPSKALANYQQSSFVEYQRDTVAWLKQNRVFVSENKAAEIEANSPFELKPSMKSNRGILLVHGLAGSPFYFKDIAKELVEKGFIVRVMLVPGHGSKPADLKHVTLKSWEEAVLHQVEMFKKEVEELWLGGFSTGANLVTSLAIENPDISGLLLFSPGFKSNRKGLFLAPFASKLVDWVDVDVPVGNYTKYESLTTQAAANYYLSAMKVVKQLKQFNYDKPVLITISEDDVVIDSNEIYELFTQNFTHPESRLVWYGDKQLFTDKRVIYHAKNIPIHNISTFSHMNVLFSPQNTFYGKAGSFKFCSEDLTSEAFRQCKIGRDTWYAEYGYSEAGRIHARLSWNPYFLKLSEQIDSILR